MIKEILVALIIFAIWIAFQVKVDSLNPCSNFAPSNIAGGCQQDIEYINND